MVNSRRPRNKTHDQQVSRCTASAHSRLTLARTNCAESGVRIKIQEQSFVVLLKLLEHPGELVTREQLRTALWPADTFVDFDTGLNTVIKRLREVLRDSAEGPQFIETVPKLGYRFIAPVQAPGEQQPAGIPPGNPRASPAG